MNRLVDPFYLTQLQKRQYNFHQVAARLLTHGIDSYLIPRAWDDIHFLAYNLEEKQTMFCHLSNRLRIETKLEGRDLMVAFPIAREYYFLEHDVLVDLSGEYSNFLNTNSWADGKYETQRPNREMLAALQEYKI